MVRNLKALRFCIAAAFVAGAGAAHSATSTTPLSVSITIGGSCSVSGSTITFPTVLSLGANVDATGSFTVGCNLFVPYNVGLDAGAWRSDVANRKMKGGTGAQFVNYALYRDAARTQNWGQTIGSDTITGTGFAPFFVNTHTIYARVPAQVTPANGGYLDNVRIIVTY